MIQQMVDRAAELFDTTPKDVVGTARFREFVMPRFAVYLAAWEHNMGLREIARKMGKDRNTVRSGIVQAEEHFRRDAGFAKKVNELIELGNTL